MNMGSSSVVLDNFIAAQLCWSLGFKQVNIWYGQIERNNWIAGFTLSIPMIWSSNINYGSEYFGAILIQTSVRAFSVSTCIIWTCIVMPRARQPPGETNSGFRLCKHTTLSQLTGLSLRPERTLTCTGGTARILSLHSITSRTDVPPFQPRRGQTLVLLYFGATN